MSQRTSSPNLAAFQAKYTYKNPLLRYANSRFLETIQTMLGQVPFDTLLDIGCGEGIVLGQTAITSNARITGIDRDPDRINLAMEYDTVADLVIGDAQDLPYDEGTFDIVLMLELLEHVGNPQIALDEAHRVSGRYLLASVPHEPWWRLGNMARLKYLRDFGNTPEHINHWTLPGFKTFLSSRFSILEVRNPVLWTFVLAEKRT
ncbi:MAG: methyltransferase domain-containing protein [Anaerolineales bacterium]|nr:methyltransferase domain-containing protein [Anaerolineales bacterium]